jgi:hypothetical protein
MIVKQSPAARRAQRQDLGEGFLTFVRNDSLWQRAEAQDDFFRDS